MADGGLGLKRNQAEADALRQSRDRLARAAEHSRRTFAAYLAESRKRRER